MVLRLSVGHEFSGFGESVEFCKLIDGEVYVRAVIVKKRTEARASLRDICIYLAYEQNLLGGYIRGEKLSSYTGN